MRLKMWRLGSRSAHHPSPTNGTGSAVSFSAGKDRAVLILLKYIIIRVVPCYNKNVPNYSYTKILHIRRENFYERPT